MGGVLESYSSRLRRLSPRLASPSPCESDRDTHSIGEPRPSTRMLDRLAGSSVPGRRDLENPRRLVLSACLGGECSACLPACCVA
ncbi:hypothetical protein E2C01_067244 [Portunus trituberculatus]|uniref:Uncharacterized protein n=1 Tax=Portunus trituberculatus TaxID=210409 RepID=A0A5B7HKH1_PORTR|nr:hypothetical protein [Portunus trituberculatus]